jgi:PiT family inorganic phosphate transporter
MDVAQGFTAQTSGAAVILAASHVGFPLSTTHVISGGIMGAGAAKRVSAVRWGVAGNIVVAWILTLPAAGATAAGVYGLTRLLGGGSLGALAVIALVIIAAIAARVRRAAPAVGTDVIPQGT